MQYRKEIDGLRAIAVISVVFFHAELNYFSGGFIGVDIFFVISGYLITSILIKDISQEKFSFSYFYERRIRRIIPALFTVTIATLTIGHQLLRPDLFKDLSQSISALMLMSSNILFWKETGYFAAAADEKPLLHTWSLSVEEQFYIIFPVLMLFLWKRHRENSFFVLALIAASSLLLSEIGAVYFATANFFLLPGRIWELLTGSLVAIHLNRRPQPSNAWLASAGLLLVAISIFYFDEHTPFPSLYTVIPILGTCLIILFCSTNDTTGRLLSAPPVVAIGLMSYSIYLWHQPILAYSRVLSLEPPTLVVTATAVGLSFILGWLTWRFVEKPFRHHASQPPKRKQVFAVTGVLSLALFTVGAWGHLSRGAPERFSSTLQRQFSVAEDPGLLEYGCTTKTVTSINVCGFGDWTSNQHTALLIGNSHARMFIPELNKSFAQNNIRGIHSRYSFKSDDLALHNNSPESLDIWKQEIKSLAGQSDAIIVSMRWTQQITAQLNYFIEDSSQNSPELQKTIYDRLHDRLSWIASLGKPVVLVLPVPEAPINVPKQMLLQNKLPMIDFKRNSPKALHDQKNRKTQELLTEISKREKNVLLLDPGQDLCSKDECMIYINNFPAYYDDNHLTSVGSRTTAIRITQILQSFF
ncbi:acyltransferase family protein [Thalassospira tepidiphila]|uniref:acyltransferase family protein n=1 Tax=Thalassospira tepidiphila TaxID=393657 RepID=UPI0030C6B577